MQKSQHILPNHTYQSIPALILLFAIFPLFFWALFLITGGCFGAPQDLATRTPPSMWKRPPPATSNYHLPRRSPQALSSAACFQRHIITPPRKELDGHFPIFWRATSVCAKWYQWTLLSSNLNNDHHHHHHHQNNQFDGFFRILFQALKA